MTATYVVGLVISMFYGVSNYCLLPMDKTNFCILSLILFLSLLCNSQDYEYDDYNYNEYYDYNSQKPEDYTDDYSQDPIDYYNQNLPAPPNHPPHPPRPLPTQPPPLPPPPPMGKITFFYFLFIHAKTFFPG